MEETKYYGGEIDARIKEAKKKLEGQLVLARAEIDGLGSALLSLQQDCVKNCIDAKQKGYEEGYHKGYEEAEATFNERW